ncbi:MAG: T9SS type A sorting domain-containing protein [Prevotellaceae bacterium]|nr:T9SS type A sorting domain-containing protein [Candidatus Minthosoma caballi]
MRTSVITKMRYVAVLLLTLFVGVQTAHADNEEFDQQHNFMVTRQGESCLHFRVLTWAYGGYKNHWADPDKDRLSTITVKKFKLNDSGSRVNPETPDEKVTLANFYGHNSDDEGKVWFKLNKGTAQITNIKSQLANASMKAGEEKMIEVTSSDKYTFLEFDWFPDNNMIAEYAADGETLIKYELEVSMVVYDRRNDLLGKGENTYPKDVKWTFNLSDAFRSATLNDPVFYPLGGDENIGKLAVPYSLMSRPLSYHTSWDTETENSCASQGGMIYVNAEDTCRASFMAYFTVVRDATKNLTWMVASNAVTVQPYHRIHDFKVSEYVPEEGATKGLYTGAKKLEWDIHYSDEKDILADDGFVIERAYKGDFSDAEQIESVPFVQTYFDKNGQSEDGKRVNNKYHYEYVDDSQGAWYNPENPERPVFYRVRRASSEYWGWDHEWAAKDSIAKPVYLASPSRNIEAQVAKDADFERNRKIEVVISMDASCVPSLVKHEMKGGDEFENIVRNLVWNESATLNLVRHMSHTEGGADTETMKIPVLPTNIAYDPVGKCWKARVYDTPKFPCTYYSYTVEVETDFNTTLPKMKDENIKNIIPPTKEGSTGDYLVEVTGATAVPDYSSFALKTENFYFNTAAKVTNLQASMDTYNDHVALTWENEGGECDYYIIKRSNGVSTDLLTPISNSDLHSDCFYNDTTAIGGVKYTYSVQAVVNCANSKEEISEAMTADGRANRKAHIFGKLFYTNGMAVAGVAVEAKYSGETYRDTTKEDGSYMITIPERPKIGDEKQVTLSVVDANYNFTIPGQDDQQKIRTINLTDQRKNVYDCDFASKNYLKFTGRVLYEGTSVPVSGASFLISGNVAKNKDGKDVITDSQGNFELTVPKDQKFTLQTVKDKHHFLQDGFFMVTNTSTGELTKDLSFKEHQYEKYMWDQTKVKLIGRVVGGNDQGNMILGMDRSKNNLGDDLQMVLALEGNDVAHLVYNPKDRTQKERDAKFVHADGEHETNAHFELKRIVVRPDSASGEFVLELLPEKYKVIQATAKGYSTLFAKNVGATVVDLTNKLDTMYIDTGENGKEIPYNEHFSIIYHTPVQLTFQQTNYGRAIDYFGDEKLVMSDFNSKTTYLKAAEVQKDGSVSYTFGYPVFNGISIGNAAKNKYAFSLSAHEDYYYNNDKQAAAPDVVYMNGGKVKVSNGFDIKPDAKNEYVQLDSKGKGIAQVTVYNPTFKLTGEDALRNLQFSMDYNGETVFSETLRAFVTGAKEMGSDVIGKDVKVLDVLRDPPGSASYAWLDEGSTYSGTYTMDISWKAGFRFDFLLGTEMQLVSGLVMLGAGNAAALNASISTDGKVKTFPLEYTYSDKWKNTWGYSYSTTERIQTSSSESYVGNMGNVYIGTEIARLVHRFETIAAINDSTYLRLKPAINSGEVKILAEGTTVNAEGKEEPVYLAVSRQISFSALPTSTFAHTQKHIIKNLLPELKATRDALIQIGDESTLQNLAKESGKTVYRSKVPIDDENFGLEDYYDALTPNGKAKLVDDDEVKNLNEIMATWITAIAGNEKITLEAFYQPSKVTSMSVSAGTSKQITETATYSFDHNAPTIANDVANSFIKGGSSAVLKYFDFRFNKVEGKESDPGKNGNYKDNVGMVEKSYKDLIDLIKDREQKAKDKNKKEENEFSIAGLKTKIQFHPIGEYTPVYSLDQNKKHTRTVGFKIEEGNHGHINVGVYRTPKTLEKRNVYDYLLFPGGEEDDAEVQKLLASASTTIHLPSDKTDDDGKTVDMNWSDEKYNAADYVFVRYGGATRCPYEDAEYTYFYQPGTKISNATLKIDDPHIQVLNPVVSDVPVDQPAVFDLVLSNESEAPEADGYLIDKTFNFSIDGSTNPNGAKFYLDGYPLANGMSLVIPRGKPVHKKLEVYRGSVDDYENIKLQFYTACEFANGVNTNISVHFQPSSTALNLSSPTDKWVMITLSAKNEGKFYIPVKIDGFNTEYRNFDHIELQYKRTTQPDADYVNLCSFYADSTLYAQASGEKRFIKGGVIDDLYFYGENDPVEQNYDLRAVSFCRLGNDFVTRSSQVLSGVKDTRRPEVFGSVSPKTGVLGIGDYIGIPFSEDIAGNHLDKTTSFEVMGYTNKTGIVNSTSLQFDGKDGCGSTTEVSRSLANKDFTIDMMVLTDTLHQDKMTFFSQGNEDSNIEFGCFLGKYLFLRMIKGNEVSFVTSDTGKPFCDGKNWARVSAVYESGSGKVVLYKDATAIGSATLVKGYDGVGKLRFGCSREGDRPLTGNMLESRLWTKALTEDELKATNKVTLTGYERNLLAYYPMNEGRGKLLEDKANGATLVTNGLTWSTPSGLSLKFNGTQGVQLDESLFSRSSESSYMLGLWFKADTLQNDSITALYAEGDGTKATGGLFIGLENKQLKVAQHGFSAMAKGNYCDDNWHHFVLGVNRTTNKAHVNVDGKRVMQFAADSLGALGIHTLMLGSYSKEVAGQANKDVYCLKGNIDDVMLWQTVMSDGYMERFDNCAPNGGELGLIVNLPFSKAGPNDNNFIENVFDDKNHLTKKTSNAAIAEKKVIKSAYAKDMTDYESVAPVKAKDLISTLGFSFASKDNELVINLKVDDAEINKQNVFITVYDVEDKAGNTIESPVNMTVFVDRNQLKWDQKYVDRKVRVGNSDEFSVDIHNLGGSLLNYRIEDLPAWLVPSDTVGYLAPTDIQPMKFKVKNNLNPGEHSALIYLVDENDLYEPLLVTVSVEAEAPDWAVNKNKFSETMHVVGSVKVKDGDKDVYDTNKNDIVGAFIGNVCVGVQKIDETDDQGSVYMTIYGNDMLSSQDYKDMYNTNDTAYNVFGKEVVFRLYRPKTGQVNELALELEGKDTVVVFTPNMLYGMPGDPVYMTTMERSSQIISLSPGWNWVSFNIATDKSKGHFSEIIANRYEFNDGDLVKGKGTLSQYHFDTGWVGNMNQFNHRYCYMLNVQEGGQMEIFGDNLASSKEDFIYLKQGWNHLPYFCKSVLGLKEAMADYLGSEGDVIKSYTEFAVRDKDGKWKGSLSDMHPGQGYMIYCANQPNKVQFRYPTNELHDIWDTAMAAPRRAFVGEHSGNMTVVAEALCSDGTKAGQGDVLQAYCGDELVGEAVADADGRFYLMTSAEQGDMLSFRITRSGDDSEATITTAPILGFDEEVGIGTIAAPFVVDFRSSNAAAYPNPFRDVITFSAISNPGDKVSIVVYDAAGSMVFSHESIASGNRFDYTTHQLAGLASGVYVARISVGGVDKSVKIVKKN